MHDLSFISPELMPWFMLFNSTEAMRIHGGFGYSPEYNIERYYRDAPLLAIGEGTNELQKLIIAKQLVSDN